jgi:hypothetical protein
MHDDSTSAKIVINRTAFSNHLFDIQSSKNVPFLFVSRQKGLLPQGLPKGNLRSVVRLGLPPLGAGMSIFVVGVLAPPFPGI